MELTFSGPPVHGIGNPQPTRVTIVLDPLEQEAIRIREEWDKCSRDPFRASSQSKFDRYDIPVDHTEGDRATLIKMCSFKRPHMRGLHCAWIAFFLAFMVWFAPAPLLVEIQESLGLTKAEVWTSNITNDVSAIIMRIVMGPVCDNYGPRLPMAFLLMAASIPTACLGLVNSAQGLAVLRFFIGIAGSSFVMSQFWPSRMFVRDIAGTANGIVGGWGNLGGAWAQLFMGTILFPAFENYYGGNSEKAWRTICVIPASMAFAFGAILPFISDDAPMGGYREMKEKGAMDRIFFTTSLRSGVTRNTWILFVQYASCFGVELLMNNASVLYFHAQFGLDTEQAAFLGFLYGSMNIFARALGGLASDWLNTSKGMRGRLWLQLILLMCEGVLVIVFANARTLTGAVVTMCIFSVFTQSAEGAIFGVVPYVHKMHSGAVAGFVGAGGNVGSMVYGLGFQSLEYKAAFTMMGSIIIATSFLSVFINIPCHAGLLWGEDNNAVLQSRERFRLRRRLADQAPGDLAAGHEPGGTVECGATVTSLERADTGSTGDGINNRIPQLDNEATAVHLGDCGDEQQQQCTWQREPPPPEDASTSEASNAIDVNRVSYVNPPPDLVDAAA
jgi:MFS transporter, NNP family, nitrate/nitrite transporter